MGFGNPSYSTIAAFTNGGSTSGINSAAGWSTVGNGAVIVNNPSGTNNDYLKLTDARESGVNSAQQPTTFTTVNAITVAANGAIRFDYRTANANSGDEVSWRLLDSNGNPVAGAGGTLSRTNSFTTISKTGLAAGGYKLEFTVKDGSSNGALELRIDDIQTGVVSNTVVGPTGQHTIVNTAGDLAAALQGGSSSTDLANVGNDTVLGGDGDDIIFGDAINTDHLIWAGREDVNSPNYMAPGSGLNALEKYLEITQGVTSAGMNKAVYDYIQENHADFNVSGDTRGGNDILNGGDGDDIIYGQGGDDVIIGGKGDDILYGGTGNDTFTWNAGDQGSLGTHAHDIVKDFGVDENGANGKDVLDLRDLLSGHGEDLTQYLSISNEGANTVIKVSTAGQVATETEVDQIITLEGINLATGSPDLIDSLIAQGTLIVD